MDNYSEITSLFLNSLRITLKNILPLIQEPPKPCSENSSEPKIPVIEREIDIDPNEKFIIPEYAYRAMEAMPKPEPYRNCYSSEPYSRFPIIPQELLDTYLRFFTEYDENKDEASKIVMAYDYSLLDLINHLRFDIFLWIASELLFAKPEEYEKKQMACYYSFHSSNKISDGRMECSDKVWDTFKEKRHLLTGRIKSFPMPPHFMCVYSDSNIKLEKGKNKANPSYDFFVKDDIYEKLYLEDFLEFEKIIQEGLIHPRNSILNDKEGLHNKPSALLESLVDAYIERVFGFFPVRCAAFNLEEQVPRVITPPSHDKLIVGLIKIAKSNDMIFSKIGFTNTLLYNGAKYIKLFRAVKQSFSSAACLVLNRFIKDYDRKFNFRPDQALNHREHFNILFNHLSTIYNELILLQGTKRTFITDNSPHYNLTNEKKSIIMKHIANPHNTAYEGDIDNPTLFLEIDRDLI